MSSACTTSIDVDKCTISVGPKRDGLLDLFDAMTSVSRNYTWYFV